MKLEELLQARKHIERMAKGLNPYSGKSVKKSSFIKKPVVAKSMKWTLELLNQEIRNNFGDNALLEDISDEQIVINNAKETLTGIERLNKELGFEFTSEALSFLNERESLILRMRYGLDGQDAFTLQVIGDTLGITRERVRQLENRAIMKIKRRRKTIEKQSIIATKAVVLPEGTQIEQVKKESSKETKKKQTVQGVISEFKGPYMTVDEINSFSAYQAPCSISFFCRTIYEYLNDETKRKITYSQVEKWLVQEGFLSITTENGKRIRHATDAGEEIGISSSIQVDSSGNTYHGILLNQNAQKMIIENINRIIVCEKNSYSY